MAKYKFKKGKFGSSGLQIGLHTGTTEETYKVKFSKECLYTPIDWENDYNKLCGWSYGILPVKWEEGFSHKPDFRLFGVDYVWAHHYNSIRVCQRCSNNAAIELCLYVYENGIRKVFPARILLDVEQEFRLLTHWNNGLLTIIDEESLFMLASGTYNIKPSWGYRLFPYFGGNNPAPHDMSIELERL